MMTKITLALALITALALGGCNDEAKQRAAEERISARAMAAAQAEFKADREKVVAMVTVPELPPVIKRVVKTEAEVVEELNDLRELAKSLPALPSLGGTVYEVGHHKCDLISESDRWKLGCWGSVVGRAEEFTAPRVDMPSGEKNQTSWGMSLGCRRTDMPDAIREVCRYGGGRMIMFENGWAVIVDGR